MSNWNTITTEDVQAVGAPEVIAAAEAKTAGATAEAIANAIAEVRQAVSTGNSMDVDTAKVPNSLKSLAARKAYFELADLINFELGPTLGKTKDNDVARIKRIMDEKIRVELPDNLAAGSGEMQSQPNPSIKRRRRRFTGWEEDGL